MTASRNTHWTARLDALIDSVEMTSAFARGQNHPAHNRVTVGDASRAQGRKAELSRYESILGKEAM